MMGKIYVVGLGPGAYEQMTIRAEKCLKQCDVIIGYTVYVDLIRDYFPEKTFLTTPMRKEVERCRLCFEEAKKGKTVAMICSGDAGVYGMSGLVYEVGKEYEGDILIEVIPGVTAALSGSAVLGAPLVHDFAVISLSDLLTPWEKIEKRLLAAAMADFCISIYNPSSRKRKDYLKRAVELLLQYKTPDTVCGYVKNIGRLGEAYEICTLQELLNKQVDMFTTVFIGNEETQMIDGKIVTPRGYVRE